VTARLVVLISGNGSNLQAILDASRHRILDAQVVAVISNRKDAYGLQRAEKAGVPVHHLSLKKWLEEGKDRRAYDAALAEIVAQYDPDLIVLAGWMLVLSAEFLDRFPWRVVNLHPALPGTFPGTHAIEDAYTAYKEGKVKKTGVMVHLVPDEAVDAGPVIESEEVAISPNDTLESLRARIHLVEHRVLIAALTRLIAGDESSSEGGGNDEGDYDDDLDDDAWDDL